MNKFNKLTIVLVCILLILSPLSPINTEAATFSDISTSNANYKAINWAVDNEIMTVTNSGKFEANKPVSEVDLLTMIAKLDRNYSYSLTKDMVYNYYNELYLPINKMQQNMIVTRGHFARIYAAIEGLDLSEPQAVQNLYMNEITFGATGKKTYPDYNPNKNVTKGDLATLLYRIASKGAFSVDGLSSKATGKDDSTITLPLNFLSEEQTVELESPSGSKKNDYSDHPNVKNEVKEITLSKEELNANGTDASLVSISLKDSNGNEIEHDTSLQFKATSLLGAKISSTPNENSSHSNIIETDGGEINFYVTAPKLTKSSKDTIKLELINNNDPKFSSYKNKEIEVNLRYVPQPELKISYEVYDPAQGNLGGNTNDEGVKRAPLPKFDPGEIQITGIDLDNKTFKTNSDQAVQYEFAQLSVGDQKISVWLFEQILYQQLQNSTLNGFYLNYSLVDGQPKYNFQIRDIVDGKTLEQFNKFDLPATVYYLLQFLPSEQDQLSMIHYDSIKVIKALYDKLLAPEKNYINTNFSKEVSKLNDSNEFIDTLKTEQDLSSRPEGLGKYTKVIISLIGPGGNIITDYRGTVNITHNGISRDVSFITNTTDYATGTGHVGAAVLYTDSIIYGESTVTAKLPSSSKDTRYNKSLASLFDKEVKEKIFADPTFIENKCTRDVEVAYVLDQSGSMKKNDPKNYASQKTRKLIDQLQAQHNIAIRFNTKGHLEATGTTESVLSKSNLYDAANIKGGTNIASGLDLALSNFTTNSTTSKSIILISDGKSTKKQIDQMVRKANQLGVKIFTIGVGQQKNIDVALLKELANKTNGQFYHIDDIHHLHAAYQTIIDAILCDTVVPENSCLAENSIFSSVDVEIRKSNVLLTANININCGNVEKVQVLFKSVNGQYYIDLMARGNNLFRTVQSSNQFASYNLYSEIEFIAYDENGNIIGTKDYNLAQ